MIELNSGLETGMVATGVVAMFSMAVWLFFRNESNGEKSLFLKMISPHDGKNEMRSSILQFLPPLKEGLLKVSRKNIITVLKH